MNPPISKNTAVSPQKVLPVLEFPQAELDDSATYHGYTTRFFKDSDGNTLQIAINQNMGRIVHAWANAANESISFTARGRSDQPVVLSWASATARLFSEGKIRWVGYALSTETTSFDLGHFLLGSMRQERDFQHSQRHLLPFDAEPLVFKELEELVQHIARLPAEKREQHLSLLNAQTAGELQLRLMPQIEVKSESNLSVKQMTFDGKNNLTIEFSIDPAGADIAVSNGKISIDSLSDKPILMTIKISSDAPSLTPLVREDIFTKDFFRFFQPAKTREGASVQFQRLERQVKSAELLSFHEKLMAGLPNYATYFGRDTMMTTLMMEPIWTPAMLEKVIATVLRKLKLSGEVSHEESLGGQAIRDNAAKYNGLVARYFQKKDHDKGKADSFLVEAKRMLENLQTAQEDYRMSDDDFQLPVLVARYLARSDLAKDAKRKFLLSVSDNKKSISRLALLLSNLVYVTNCTAAYVANPVVENLIGFPKFDENRWFWGSWRDSPPGYANGRFAMDINVIRVPIALESIAGIFAGLSEIGISPADLEAEAPKIHDTKLMEYARNPETLGRAIKIWHGADCHFQIRLDPQEAFQRVQHKLQWLPIGERRYWEEVLAQSDIDEQDIEFLALSLNEKGEPIPVANTDTATWFFFQDFTHKILQNEIQVEDVIDRLRIFVTPYPKGLFLEGVGLAVANDAYASSAVWNNFEQDFYHSPRTVWGREVNLLLLGLARQILAAFDSGGRLKDPSLRFYVRQLRVVFDRVQGAVESSGLKYNELWSYAIRESKLLPARYTTSCDIQFWNLTDLAVQYVLEQLQQLDAGESTELAEERYD